MKIKNEFVRNLAGVIILYLVLVLGVIAINARMESINSSSSSIVFSN